MFTHTVFGAGEIECAPEELLSGGKLREEEKKPEAVSKITKTYTIESDMWGHTVRFSLIGSDPENASQNEALAYEQCVKLMSGIQHMRDRGQGQPECRIIGDNEQSYNPDSLSVRLPMDSFPPEKLIATGYAATGMNIELVDLGDTDQPAVQESVAPHVAPEVTYLEEYRQQIEVQRSLGTVSITASAGQ